MREEDVFFRWSTALWTLGLDGILLLLTLLIARGLPAREVFALRPPRSWPDAGRLALMALGLSWLASLALELTVGHEIREQAVPSYWDPARSDAFVANLLAVAVFVPIVEESMCRGLGFFLLLPFGEAVAIAGTTIAFAAAHGALLDLPWLLVTGAGLAYVRSRSASLYPAILLHATVNGVAVLASAFLMPGPPA